MNLKQKANSIQDIEQMGSRVEELKTTEMLVDQTKSKKNT